MLKIARLLFVLTLLLTPPLAAGGETGKAYRIGALTTSWGPGPSVVGLRDGLEELGYKENRDFVIGVRFTRGNVDDLPDAARQLVEYEVDLIFAVGTEVALAARLATQRIPIVFYAAAGNPVEFGLVDSFTRPGENVTGVTSHLDPRKRLEIFRELLPDLRRVLFVHHATEAYALWELKAYRDAARRLGIALVERPVRTEVEARTAFGEPMTEQVDGILSPQRLHLNIPGLVLATGAAHAVPTMFAWPFFLRRDETGAFASYGPNLYEGGRQAARLVAKILAGGNPTTIPVEADPIVPELVINLKTAKTLGLTIPQSVLIRADEIIE